MDTQQQVEYYRGRIKEMLRRVPPSVNRGSYDHAVAFKKLAAKADKAVNAPRAKLEVLVDIHNQLNSYY